MASSIRLLCNNSRRYTNNISRTVYNINRLKSTTDTKVYKSEILASPSPDFLKRFKVTAEVTLSKIFPAGFGIFMIVILIIIIIK